MKFDYVGLKEHCSKIGSGSTPRGGETVYVKEGVSFIRSQNVYNLDFHTDGLAHITDEVAEKMKSVSVLENDILLNITGDSVARTCLVPQSVLPARVNQHVAIIRPKESDFNSQFLSYYMASPFMQARMLGLAVGKGASRNAITKEMIEGFEVPYPPLPTQRRIADILSAYDDLIENNRKQIKLLEEAAQRLYKEWFVDLRFPGHEKVKVTDGVPEGWERKPIGSLFSFKYGKNLPTSQICENGKYPVYGANGTIGYFDKYTCDNFVVLVTSRGNGSGDVLRTFDKYSYVTNNSFVVTPLNKEYLYPFAYRMLLCINFKSVCSGSAQPQLTNVGINTLFVIAPKIEIVKLYCNIVVDWDNDILLLKKQIKLLQEARDRLLPKLMSGEIEV